LEGGFPSRAEVEGLLFKRKYDDIDGGGLESGDESRLTEEARDSAIFHRNLDLKIELNNDVDVIKSYARF
jgi:hypothetical protein